MATPINVSASKKIEQRRSSTDTCCSSNANCVLRARKPVHPYAVPLRNKTVNNPVTQRVLSAKLLRFKTLQNKLSDANFHIAQLLDENKFLKNLQKRQDHALSRYEGTTAQLPQLLGSHEEEVRVLQSKNKTLRITIKELTANLKRKDMELTTLRDEHKHLMALCKSKNLEEREKLTAKVADLTERLRQNDATISTLNRKLMLESKNYKFRLNSELIKHKQSQVDLHRALSQIKHLNSLLQEKDKNIDLKEPRFVTFEKKQSTVNFTFNKERIKKEIYAKSESPKSNSSSSLNLSGKESPTSFSNKSEASLIQEPTSSEKHSSTPRHSSDGSVSPTGIFDKDLDSSESQLKQVVNHWQKKKIKEDDSLSDELDKYYNEIISSSKTKSIVSKNSNEFKTSLEPNEFLNKNALINDKFTKLKLSDDKIYNKYPDPSPARNNGLLPHFSQNERKYKHSFEEELLSGSVSTRSDSIKPEINIQDKNKLLAKLNAIEDDDILFSDLKKSKCDVMKELFG